MRAASDACAMSRPWPIFSRLAADCGSPLVATGAGDPGDASGPSRTAVAGGRSACGPSAPAGAARVWPSS